MYLYLYIYIYNIHNNIHISSNMPARRIYLEIASLVASRRTIFCIFFLHTWTRMRENWRLRQAMLLHEWRKKKKDVGGNEQKKNEWRDERSVLFTHVDCIPLNSRPLFLFPACYNIFEKMTNEMYSHLARVYKEAVKCNKTRTSSKATNTFSGFFGFPKNCT